MFKFLEFYPENDYSFAKGQSKKTITNILHRVKVRTAIKNSTVFFTKLIVRDSDTPESLSFDLYGDTGYHWTILLANDMIDPLYDWILTLPDLRSFITQKYGAGNENAVHHYENSNKQEVLQTEPNSSIVTNTEFEDRENEKKRQILAFEPQYIPQLIREFKEFIR